MNRVIEYDLCLTCSFPGGTMVKKPTCQAGDPGSIPGSEKSPGGGNGNLLQHSSLGNPMDQGVLQATVHGVTRVLDMTEWLNNIFHLTCCEVSFIWTMWQYLIPFYGWITCCCMDMPGFIYPLISWWTFELFSLWIMVQCIFVCKFCLNICFPFSWMLSLGMELWDYMVALCLTFEGNTKLFSKAAAPYYVPTSNVWGFQLLIFVILWIFSP